MIFSTIIVYLGTIIPSLADNALGYEKNQTEFESLCTDFSKIENGRVTINKGQLLSAHIECNPGFDLEGPPKILCVNEQWEHIFPQCVPRCQKPPYINNGQLQTDSEKDENGMFRKGTVATYSCGDGYQLSPPESIYRVCEMGIWTGAPASCIERPKECKSPKEIDFGYFVTEKIGNPVTYPVGQRLRFSCNPGYFLVGTRFQLCIQDGSWSPKLPPTCSPNELAEDIPCVPIPSIQDATTTVVAGFQSTDSAISGTEIEIRCLPKFKNVRAPCQPPSRLRCNSGEWKGIVPRCVFAKECPPPPNIMHGNPIEYPIGYETTSLFKYPIGMRISYQCNPGYEVDGNLILTCSLGGCWAPRSPPVCRPTGYYAEVKESIPILVSLATGSGVLLLLLVICLLIVCRKRKPLSRAVPIPPPMPRPGLSDHASLLHHPDRLALIAFADDLQIGQSVLPTYEEATRDRGPGFITGRIQRPHWPSLVARRTRGSPNPDFVHVTRQGSFASHTPSTRSGGDPMGSTDTVAVSENSTTVTLDTASSHSGSQPASCRAHCGSLASFDTNSVLNTDGVPLLEESELEEIQGGHSVSSAMENLSMADNNSFKLTSPETA